MTYKSISRILLAGMFSATLSIWTEAKAHSKTITIEFPSDLPELAQRSSEAMYLHETGDGRAILYLEQNQGRSLAILDVTDSGDIRALAQVSLPAHAPYDFVKSLSDSAVLIQYRDHSGYAVISLKRTKQPVVVEAPQIQHPTQAEVLGHDGLVLESAAHSGGRAESPQYQIFSSANPVKPTALATVDSVQQCLERAETGTLFLLGKAGLTVVRRPDVEAEYRIESTYTN